MKSEEYKSLMNSIHNLRKKVERIELNFDEPINGTVTLDDGEEIKIKETDTVDYILSLKRVVDNDGDYIFHPVKDTEKYLNEEKFLCYDHENKVALASHELAKGIFEFSYNYEELQEEFLLSKKRSDSKYLPLKTDYFRIAASRINEAAMALQLHQKHEKESPGYRAYFDSVCKILADAFRNDLNFMKNCMKKGKNTKLNILESIGKYASAVQNAQEVRAVFSPEGLRAETGIHIVLNMYRDYAEACVEPLNLLRVAYELSNGVAVPQNTMKAQENKATLLPVLGNLMDSYNPHLRNSESHLRTKFDHKNRKLLVTDRGGYSREYTYTEIIDMTNDLANNFLPGLMNGMIMESQTVMLILSVRSAEYIAALLAIDNIK